MPEKFHERFAIPMGLEMKRGARFVNRLHTGYA